MARCVTSAYILFLFTALGIDHDDGGRKSILGYWVLLEGKESKAFWADVFQDMDGWMDGITRPEEGAGLLLCGDR